MESLDELDLGAAIAFPNTAAIPRRIFVHGGLDWTDRPRYVMEPIRPGDMESDASDSSEDDSPAMLVDFGSLNGVNATGFGPDDGGDSEGVQFRVYDNEQATWPPTKKLVLKPPKGDSFPVFPRCVPSKRVTRGCVELAVSQWMKQQRALPPAQRVHVDVDTIEYTVDGEVKQVLVWLWKGLKQVMDEPNTFEICLD